MSAGTTEGKSTISLFTATSIVVANMVGTGVFTSLGFQVGDLPSGFTIMVLWLIGGICALCGALCYGELAAALPRSGGEYHLLGQTFHPAVGFVAGWLSATVGFAAPIALAAMALGHYAVGMLPDLQPGGFGLSLTFLPSFEVSFGYDQVLAVFVVAFVSIVHLGGVQIGARFQNVATAFKLTLVLVLLIAGLFAGNSQPISFTPTVPSAALIVSAPFAISLVYVMYAYSGWNASTYIVNEIRDPARNVPRSVAIGTILVTVLYIGLNAVFLRTTPIDELRGNVEVGLIAGRHIFGEGGGNLVGAFICLGLIASISAMTWIGPRVTMTMGEDLALLRPLAQLNSRGVPHLALALQLIIVCALIVTSTFEKVLVYIQFGLALSSFLTVAGLLVLRVRRPELPRPFRTPGYPFTPLLFLAISGWLLFHILRERPVESLAGLSTLAAGLLLYFFSPKAPRGTDSALVP